MVEFSDRIYDGNNAALYNEVLNEALQLLKENPMGFAILKGANYKDVVDKAVYDEAVAKMRDGKEAGFAVETVYIGFFDKEKGSPDGARCYLAMADNADILREHARGEVYMSPTYMQSALDAFNGNKNLAALYLTNVLAHEFTHGNQETKIINEISDSVSALPDDPKKENRRTGNPKDGGFENMIITEANSDTAGFMVLKDILKSVPADEKAQIIEKYLSDIYQHGWIRSKDSLALLKEGLMGQKEVTAQEVFGHMIKGKIETYAKSAYRPPNFNQNRCEKWSEICHQKHLFGENGTNVTELFLSGMNAYKTYMAQTITPEWLSQMHPNPRVNKTNVQYLFEHFYDDAQGKDKTKIPTDDEIRAQADKYFKQFGIEGFADTFMQEAAYAHVADSKIKTYTDIIKQNAESLTELKNKATCVQNEDGSWGIKIKEEGNFQGHHVIETREIQVKKELADEIFAVYLEQEMKNEATYLLYETEYKKEHPDFDYQTAGREEQATFKRESIEWFKKAPEQHKNEAEAYLAVHRNEMLKPIEEKLLKEKVLEQVVVNYVTMRTIENTGKEGYLASKDIGHCAKSVLTYMYGLQKQNGGYAFLPENPNIAAQPEKLFEHFNENWPQRTKRTQDIAQTFKDHQPPYEEGTLALIDNGHGRHLMMYRGLNDKGEPEFVGFNPLAERQVLLNQKAGEIIDVPSLIRDETRGVLTPPQKQIDIETLKATEHGNISINMSINRTADGEKIQSFEGVIDIPVSFLSQEEITAIKSPNCSQWLKEKATDDYSQSIGGTNAQALYRKFRDNVLTESAMQQIAKIKDESQRAQKRNELVKDKMDRCFAIIGAEGFTEILMRECQEQRTQKREEIKQKALTEGMVLYHATPLSKDQLDGGILKGRVERPDLMWEEVFTGVCAFPESKGAYVLKKADELEGFACQGERNVRLTDDRLEGKKIDDVLGYIHSHRLRKDDGFMPTVSLGGEVPGEWVSKQDVSIDESKEVTLQSLFENDVHVFKVEKGFSFRDLKEYSDRIEKVSTGEEYLQANIDFMEEVASNPDKLWTDVKGNQRKMEVKSYYQFVKAELQNAAQNTNKDNELAQTILEKTGRPYAKRHMPRVKTETKKELKKLGFWNMFKKNKNRGA